MTLRLVAHLDGDLPEQLHRLAGFARVIADFVYKALVQGLIVDPAYPRTGLGPRLMDEVVGHPRLQDVVHFELYSRPDLVAFYEWLGFTDALGTLRFLRRRAPPAPSRSATRA